MIVIKSEREHEKSVAQIQKILTSSSATYSLSRSQKLSNTLRSEKYKQDCLRIDLSSLNSVLSIDPDAMTATVEPRITCKKLCENLLRFGFIPCVVPEFTSITVGGAIMGSALESTSHKEGQFNDTCLEYECILGDGSRIMASPKENSDLFYGLSGSYGSLALLTKATLRLKRAQSTVLLTMRRVEDTKEMFSLLRAPCAEEFLEGMMLAENLGAVISGNQTDHTNSLPVCRMNKSWSKWYYQHVAEATQKKERKECIPLMDYLFRTDRGAFWMGRYLLSFWTMFQILLRLNRNTLPLKLRENSSLYTSLKVPNLLFRLLFGWELSSKRLYNLWHSIPNQIAENLFFVHDFYSPAERAEEIYTLFQKKTGIFPVMLCPIKGTKTPQFFAPHYGESDFINIGLYGIPRSTQSVPALSKELEEEIVAFGGRKMLYSFTYYSEEQFAKIYDCKRAERLRKKYHAEKRFLPLYNKIANVV